MAITVAICGLVRRPQLFIEQLDRLAEARARGLIDEIFYSTWWGEVDRHPEILPALAAAGVTLIEAPEPTGYNGPSHFYKQSATLRRVVDQLPPERIVLKLRPDIAFPLRVRLDALIEHLEQEINAPITPLGGLSRRIFVGLAAASHPFWLEDRYFAGRAGDLAIICDSRIDFDHFAHPDTVFAEVRWFSRPFVDRYKLAREALRVNWILAIDPTLFGPMGAFLGLIERSADLQRMLAAYHYILERSFIVGLPSAILADDLRLEESDPLPIAPGLVDQYGASSLAGPIYHQTLRALRRDERLLTSGLQDESGLATALLDLGSMLQPGVSQSSPEVYARRLAGSPQRFAWSAAPHRTVEPAGNGMRVELAWRCTDLRSSPPDDLDLVVTWRLGGRSAGAEQVIRLAGFQRPAGEHRVMVAAPAAAGAYVLTFRLRTPDGWAVGPSVAHDLTIAQVPPGAPELPLPGVIPIEAGPATPATTAS